MSEGHDHSPLAQFEIQSLLPIEVAGLNLSFTNSSLWMMLAVAAIIMWLLPAAKKQAIVPGRLQGSAELLHGFVENIVSEMAGKEGLKYFPMIFTIFIFILISNLLGLIPYSFTTTSHISVTLLMALCVFVAVTLLAMVKHGPLHFLAAFVPEGTPVVMMPIMFLLELISYLARPISLSLRLAINMMAGHVLLKVFATLIITFGITGIFTMFPLLVAMMAFELIVAFIQAYIFAVLTCVYLNQALHLH